MNATTATPSLARRSLRAPLLWMAVLAAPVAVAAAVSTSATSAFAAEAEPAEESAKISTRVTSKGVVIAEMRVHAKAAAVRELLAGAERAHGLASTTVSVKASPDGKCEKVKLQTRGLITPFVLETRRCPTATGWRETLVTSDNFVEYWNEWTVKDLGDGALVTFKTRTLPNVAVPESLILSQTRKVLGKLMKSVLVALGET
ncbi:MAG TPA: hypothetical protein VGB85_21475 [Nannocystis sp.]